MRVGIDRAGRIVIPKQLRVSLGVGPETEFEVELDGTGLHLEPLHVPDRAVEQGDDGLPVLAAVEGQALSDDDVRRLRDDAQR